MEIEQSFFKPEIPVYMDWLKSNRNGLSYECMPHENSPLTIKDSTKKHSVYVRVDSPMGAHVAINQEWEPETLIL